MKIDLCIQTNNRNMKSLKSLEIVFFELQYRYYIKTKTLKDIIDFINRLG